MEDNKSMISTMAAHMSDAGRMLRANQSPSITTVRGLMEAVRWLDKQRRLALERLNDVEGHLFSVAGDEISPPMSLVDTLVFYSEWLEGQGVKFDNFSARVTYEQIGHRFIRYWQDNPNRAKLPGLPPAPHKPEEELDG